MRTLAITKRVLKELFRDKRTLVLMFLAPVLIMWLMNVMFSASSDTKVSLATVNVNQEVRDNLDKVKGISVRQYKNVSVAKDKLKTQAVDGIIEFHDNKYNVTYANTDATKTTLTKQALSSALTKQTINTLSGTLQKLQAMLPPAVLQTSNDSNTQESQKVPTITDHYQYGNGDTNFFTKIVPILMGFFIFLFVFLFSGMALLNERTSGTLDRLLATPVKRSEIVFGYMFSYGIIAVIQSIVIVLATVWLLKVEVVGSIGSIIFISLLFALIALAFGILLSTLANSEFQMMQFIPLVVVPQVFFSGIIPLDSMATWVNYIGKLLPLTYAGDALTKIVMEGTSITQLGGDVFALFIFLVVLVILNIIGLKRYRKV